MRITSHPRGEVLELVLEGRLDALWRGHLDAAISSAVREGRRRIELNVADVQYVSSSGVRVLMKHYRQLHDIGGSLSLTNASGIVAEALDLMGLGELMAAEPAASAAGDAATSPASVIEGAHAVFEVRDLATDASLSCRILGRPDWVARRELAVADCRELRFGPGVFAVGIGAPGDGFEECRGRFGEFLGLEGAVAYLPTEAGAVPDYLIAAGDFTPRIETLLAVACEGGFAKVVGFEAKPEQALTLTEIAEACLRAVDAERVGIAMAAEVEGLVGAALIRSPLSGERGDDLFAFPEVRDTLSFTSERAFTDDAALVVGVAARTAEGPLARALRPMRGEDGPRGHFHAAAFSYRPLRKGQTDLRETVRAFFDGESLRGLMHLVHDRRPIEGVGDSRFLRGACWIAPITTVEDDA